MCRGVSIPTEIVSAIYPDLPMHGTKGMGMHQKCFSNFPFPTDGCGEVYLYPLKLFWQFTATLHGRLENGWACTKSVLVIYNSLPRHGWRCISISNKDAFEHLR